MNAYKSNDHRSARNSKLIIPQLIVATATMQHIDELFQHVAHTIVQRLDVLMVQFWTNQSNHTSQASIQLRTLACQDPSLPTHLVANDQVAKITNHIVSERRGYNLQPVEAIFSLHQSSLLKRYGLNYCITYFIGRNVLLPSPSSTPSLGNFPVLFAMTVWLFLRQSPPQDLPPSIGIILEQAITIAESRSLLLPAGNTSPSANFQFTPTPQAGPTLWDLIPHRKQNANLLLSSNPFANAPIIADKKARRFHAAIDGRASVADHRRATGMDEKEVVTALQTLIAQNHIELYTPDGQLVDASYLTSLLSLDF